MDETMPEAMLDDLSLVPPRRLGVLLQQKRRVQELSLDDLARRSEGRLLVSDLEQLEQGRLPVDDDLAAELVRLYRIDAGPIVPQRSELVLDLRDGTLQVGDRADDLPDDAAPQVILGRYLALVQLLRAWEPGHPLPLRTDDLAILGRSLGLAPATVERRLLDLLETGQVEERAVSLRRRLAIPAAGLLVGTTAVGALVLVRSGSDSSSLAELLDGPEAASATVGSERIAAALLAAPGTTSAPADVEPAPDPVEAVSAEAPGPEIAPDPAEAPEPEIAPADPVVESEPEVDIGEPLTIEPGDDVELGEPVTVTPDEPASEPVISDPVATAIGAEAEALIAYPWSQQLPGWTVVYQSTPGVVTGNTNVPSQTITVAVPAGADAGYVSEVLAHELGHALDLTYLDNSARTRWLASRGRADATWWPAENAASDFDTGAGDFAEAVSALMTGSPSDSTLAGEFTPAQLDLVAQLLPPS